MIRPGKRGGGHSGRDTPGPFPFPNPEAKTASADGTAPARVWESRTPPPAHHKGGPATGPPFSRTHTATRPHRPPHARPHDKVRQPAIVNPTITRHSAPRTRTATPATHAIVNPTARGHTRPQCHTATHARGHTRQSSSNRTGSLRICFGLGLSCGRMVLNVVGLASVC